MEVLEKMLLIFPYYYFFLNVILFEETRLMPSYGRPPVLAQSVLSLLDPDTAFTVVWLQIPLSRNECRL